MALVEVLEAAVELDDLDSINDRLERFRRLSPAEQQPFSTAQTLRFGALLAVRAGESAAAGQRFEEAGALLREIGARFYLAVVQLEHGRWLVETERADEAEPLLAEARGIFEELQAVPWLRRLEAVGEPAPA
jgi:hypothetical protein